MQTTVQRDEDHFQVEKQRLDSFRMGSERPLTGALKVNTAHRRAHSRSTSSVSSMSAFSFPPAAPKNDMPAPLPPLSTSKRHSHHRRQSSVSTRHESADVMGLSLPDLPPASSDDNINLGGKDSIRRRALMALEGRSELGSFSKMEIPELVSPKVEQTAFSFPSKPSFPPGLGGANSLAITVGKRDSFGKSFTPSSSLKDQLHTLIEEEEDEEGADASILSESPQAMAPAAASFTTPSGRPRPAALDIKSATCSLPSEAGLPTPSLTPSPRTSGLRPLTLSSFPTPYDGVNAITNVMKRQSWTTPPLSDLARWQSLGFDSPPSDRSSSSKRTSISYMSGDSPLSSLAALPTPEATPRSLNRRLSLQSHGSNGSRSSEGGLALGRPLSVSEQHFLFKSHNALLARIEDLERSLRSQSRTSRCSSTLSETSSSAPSEPSEELLSFAADLKAERDELKADVDGWRARVADYEKQVVALARRIEAECRNVSIAQERTTTVEAEKAVIESALVRERVERGDLQDRLDAARRQCSELGKQLIAQADEKAVLEAEVAALRAQLMDERRRRENVESELEVASPITAPFDAHIGGSAQTVAKNSSHGFRFQSIDSQATDVESLDGGADTFTLKAVAEEDEDLEENELLHYEDEDENDQAFGSPSSSTTSLDDEHVEASPSGAVTDTSLEEDEDTVRTPRTPSPMVFTPAHAAHRSLSKTWTFPRSVAPTPQPKQPLAVDRFFACLEDDNSSHDPLARTEEAGKNLFCQLANEDDELPPFVLPSHVGLEVDEERVMDEVLEECARFEDEFDGEEVEGGIRFVFNATLPVPAPVQSSASPSKLLFASAPMNEGEDGERFTLPQVYEAVTSMPRSVPTSSRSATSAWTPSSITSLKASGIPQPRSFALPRTPPAAAAARKDISTNIPTFIPQPCKPAGAGTSPRLTGEFKFPPRAVTTSTPPLSSSLSRHAPNPIPFRHDDPCSPESASSAVGGATFAPAQCRASHTSSCSVQPSSSMIFPRRAFETFTNLIPAAFSWTARSPDVPATVVPAPAGVPPLRSLASREQQLEKLRRRMEDERRSKRASHVDTFGRL